MCDKRCKQFEEDLVIADLDVEAVFPLTPAARLKVEERYLLYREKWLYNQEKRSAKQELQ